MNDRQGKPLGENAPEYHTNRPLENPNSVPTPPKKSEDSQSLHNQFKWCDITDSNLKELSGDLNHALEIFASHLEDLRRADYLSEYFDRLLLIFEEFEHRVTMARTHIANEHRMFVHEQKQQIQSKLDSMGK